MRFWACSSLHGMAVDIQFCGFYFFGMYSWYWSNYYFTKVKVADPSGRAVEGVVLRPLAYGDCGFEYRPGLGCPFFVGVMCCQVQAFRRADPSYRGVLPCVCV
jgi:hypothetical protein